MFQPIKFHQNKRINFQKLYLDINRRIYKIGWIIDQSNKKKIKHTDYTQTENGQYLRQSKDRSIKIRNANDYIGHTRENSTNCMGANSQYHSISNIAANIIVIGTDISIDGLLDSQFTEQLPCYQPQNEVYEMRENLQENNLKQNQNKIKNTIKQQIEDQYPENVDFSLENKLCINPKQQILYNKSSSNQQSMLMSKKSDDYNQNEQLLSKSNLQTKSVSRLLNSSRQKNDKNSDYSNKSKRRVNKKENQNIQIEDQFSEKNQIQKFYDCVQSLRKNKQNPPGFLRGRKNQGSVKQKKSIEKVVVHNDVKERMKKLVQDILSVNKKEASDHTARSNLLKRIQEKYKPKKN